MNEVPYTLPNYYVRKCYSEYYTLILKTLEKYCYITLTGTPGIGKSMFYAYVFQHYIMRPRTTIVAASFPDSSVPMGVTVFRDNLTESWQGTNWDGFIQKAYKAASERGDDVIHLYDGPPPFPPCYRSKMVSFTCPNKRWIRETQYEQMAYKLYMPLWTLDELFDTANHLRLGTGIIQKIPERFAIFGGVARGLFSADKNFVSGLMNRLTREVYRTDPLSELQRLLNKSKKFDFFEHEDLSNGMIQPGPYHIAGASNFESVGSFYSDPSSPKRTRRMLLFLSSGSPAKGKGIVALLKAVGPNKSGVDFVCVDDSEKAINNDEYTCPNYYVRKCFPEYYERILEKLKTFNIVTVTGTPVVVFHDDGTHTEPSDDEDNDIFIRKTHGAALTRGIHVTYLCDGPPELPPALPSEMVCFTSPNESWRRKMEDNVTACRLYMPLWTLGELIDAAKYLELRTDITEKIEERFAIFGGVARGCLSADKRLVADMAQHLIDDIADMSFFELELLVKNEEELTTRHRVLGKSKEFCFFDHEDLSSTMLQADKAEPYHIARATNFETVDYFHCPRRPNFMGRVFSRKRKLLLFQMIGPSRFTARGNRILTLLRAVGWLDRAVEGPESRVALIFVCPDGSDVAIDRKERIQWTSVANGESVTVIPGIDGETTEALARVNVKTLGDFRLKLSELKESSEEWLVECEV
ncbi:hypothetical protein P3T76_009592 [Phytophthora citrophthora]|uniref:Crinkler (CRN) family protein n=1 Tax=Phytophthora citrophthora TaxID=4793 RepID=A0AAD9GFY6_9STRA|nr:hypothetical protein P3T76_009592 [Phytophthora citrophthora]